MAAAMAEDDDLAALRAENVRLKALLDAHGIAWRLPSALPTAEPSRLATAEKVALFRKLFRGRTDIYPAYRARDLVDARFASCFVVARIFTLSDGKAESAANPATRPPAPTSGVPGSAKSRASSVVIARTACCCR
jgi:hypothetical protein